MRYESWVTSSGGAMDRVAVFCAVLLGAASAAMTVDAAFDRVGWRVAFWLVLLGLSLFVFRSARRRIRLADARDD